MHFLLTVPNSWAFGKNLFFFLLAFGFQILHQEDNLLVARGRKSPEFEALPKTPTI